MIQHSDIDQGQGGRDPIRDLAVGPTGLGDAGRVIMRQNHGGCIMFERDLHDFSGPDARRIDGAVEKFDKLDDPVLVIEQ